MKGLQMRFLSLKSEGLRDEYRELLDLSTEQLDPPHRQLGVDLVGLDLDHVIQLLPIRLLINNLSEILPNDAHDIATRTSIASASLGMLQVGCSLLNCGEYVLGNLPSQHVQGVREGFLALLNGFEDLRSLLLVLVERHYLVILPVTESPELLQLRFVSFFRKHLIEAPEHFCLSGQLLFEFSLRHLELSHDWDSFIVEIFEVVEADIVPEVLPELIDFRGVNLGRKDLCLCLSGLLQSLQLLP